MTRTPRSLTEAEVQTRAPPHHPPTAPGLPGTPPVAGLGTHTSLTVVLAATVLNIIGLAFIYTHLYQRTRSALLCVLLHGSFNAANGTLVLREEIDGEACAAMQYCMTATTLLAAVALVWWTHGRLGTDRNHPDQERAPALATARTETALYRHVRSGIAAPDHAVSHPDP